MKKPFAVAAAFATLSLVACALTPGEPGSLDQDSTALSCPQGQYFFNGACRDTCATTAGCAAGLRCMQITKSVNACLEESMGCAYLSSDTQCVGSGGYYVSSGGFRGGPATTTWYPYSSYPTGADPYLSTPYEDPYFFTSYVSSPYGGYYNAYGDESGCEGNAQWIAVPTNNGAPVACANVHEVTRCRRVNRSCRLIKGRTSETVSP